jgi:hypothetical protein
MIPAPRAVRLWTRAHGAVRDRPPLGLAGWSPDADAMAVLLEGSSASLDDAGLLAAQIPAAGTLAPSTLVLVLGTAALRGGTWRRLLGPRRVKIGRAPRCEALLARGYVDIGAAIDSAGSDLVWGHAP